MRIEFKDMDIQVLPSPTTDDSATPGFHLRTVKAGDGDRKYTVFLPNGYDGVKKFPVVLFLHGSGERGNDGVISSLVGLGAIIAGNPEDFPVIAVFPQARQTWSADSPDAEAALAALDDVLATYKADKNHVILTGLSMGGAGSWQLAAKHPERFVAVAPVCGFGTDETAEKVAKSNLPVWTFVGDADSDRILGSTRELVGILKKANANVRHTEYRGVGHNSWDRAYSDPKLLEWMRNPPKSK